MATIEKFPLFSERHIMAGGQKARLRVIHHFHGNCPSIGHLCNQRPIRPRVRLGCLCPVSASRHRQIRLSLTTLTPTRAHPSGPEWKREGTLIYFVPSFFSSSFGILFISLSQEDASCLSCQADALFPEPVRGIAFQNPICQGQTVGPFRQEPLTATFTEDQWQLYQTINQMDLRTISKR